MSSPFDEAKYNALLKGLEVSVVRFSELNKIQNRFDAEFYSKENLALEHLLQKVEYTTLSLLHCEIDCSAFYPGITQYYNFDKSGIPFIRVNELQDGFVKITDSTAFLPKNVLLENSKTIAMAYPDDIVIAKGGNTLAKVGILTNEYSEYAICRDVLLVRTNNLNFNQKYNIWAFLHSSVGYKLMVKTASQTGQPHLTVPNIASLKMPKWIETDTRFSDCYISAQSLIQKSKSLYAQAEDTLLSELGLKDWQPKNESVSVKKFSDFTASNRLDAEYYEKKYDELFEKLNHFKCTRLGDMGKFCNGSLISDELYVEKAARAYIRIKELSYKEPINDDAVVYIDDSFVSQNETTVLENDFVIATIGNTIGKVNVVPKKYAGSFISNNTSRFRLNDKKSIYFYYEIMLRSIIVQSQIEREFTQTAQPKISNKSLANILIPILSRETQEQIAELITKSFELQSESKRLLEETKKMVEKEIEEGSID